MFPGFRVWESSGKFTVQYCEREQGVVWEEIWIELFPRERDGCEHFGGGWWDRRPLNWFVFLWHSKYVLFNFFSLTLVVPQLTAEMEVKEPSISTMLINYENKSDPFDAVSPPLYQTATFKQVRLDNHTHAFFFLIFSVGNWYVSFKPFLNLEKCEKEKTIYIYQGTKYRFSRLSFSIL